MKKACGGELRRRIKESFRTEAYEREPPVSAGQCNRIRARGLAEYVLHNGNYFAVAMRQIHGMYATPLGGGNLYLQVLRVSPKRDSSYP